MSTDALGPYRAARLVARYVCVACHRSMSTLPGSCPACGVARLSLDRDDVRMEVRQHAEEQLQKRNFNEEALITGVSSFVGLALAVPFFWGRHLERGWLRTFLLVVMGLTAATRFAITRALPRLYPSSAILAMAARRERLARQLHVADHEVQLESGAVHDAGLGRHATTVDPELADLSELLRSNGAKLEG